MRCLKSRREAPAVAPGFSFQGLFYLFSGSAARVGLAPGLELPEVFGTALGDLLPADHSSVGCHDRVRDGLPAVRAFEGHARKIQRGSLKVKISATMN